MSNDLKPAPRVPLGTYSAHTSIPGDFASRNTATRPKRDELALLVNSRHPIIAVESAEEQRFADLLSQVAAQLGIPLYIWSVTTGIGKAGGAALYNSNQPEQALANIATIQGDAIFLLKDFARYWENDRISRRLRDLADVRLAH